MQIIKYTQRQEAKSRGYEVCGSALIWDVYYFPIIHVCLRSKHFLLILFSQRVSSELIGMLLEVWNPEIGMLFSIQKGTFSHWEHYGTSTQVEKKIPLSGASTFPCCPPVAVSEQLSCLLPEGRHSVILTVLMISARSSWYLLCDIDSLNPNSNCMKTTLIVPILKMRKLTCCVCELLQGHTVGK